MLQSANNSQRQITILVLLVLGHLALGLIYVFFRFVDWDEGFYLLAGKSVADGLRLYFDFFHPQAPLYPQALATLSSLTDNGWSFLYQARLLNILLGVGTMTMMGLSSRRLYDLTQRGKTSADTTGQRWQVMTVAFFLYAFSGLFLSWNTVAKPLALSQFFLVGGIFLRLFAGADFGGGKGRKAFSEALWLFFSGAILILAAQTRLPLIVVWPLLLISVFAGTDIRHKALGIVAFLTGAHLAALPTIQRLSHDAGAVLYNNLGFHLARATSPSFTDLIGDKTLTLLKLFADPQVSLVIIAVMLILWQTRHSCRFRDWLAEPKLIVLLSAALIFGAYLNAYPSMRQYFAQSLPLILIYVASELPTLANHFRRGFGSRIRQLTRGLALVYVLGLIPYGVIYLGATRDYDQRGELSRLRTICALIEDNSSEDDIIFAESPLYPLLANRRALARTEFVGFQYRSLKLEGKYSSLNLPDANYLLRQLEIGRPFLVVTDFEPDSTLGARLKNNYLLIFKDDYATVFRRNSPSESP